MAKPSTLTTFRDWAAFVGAVGMVMFLTFVPQHASTSAQGPAVQRVADESWPSQTAALGRDAGPLR